MMSMRGDRRYSPLETQMDVGMKTGKAALERQTSLPILSLKSVNRVTDQDKGESHEQDHRY